MPQCNWQDSLKRGNSALWTERCNGNSGADLKLSTMGKVCGFSFKQFWRQDELVGWNAPKDGRQNLRIFERPHRSRDGKPFL